MLLIVDHSIAGVYPKTITKLRVSFYHNCILGMVFDLIEEAPRASAFMLLLLILP